MRIPIVDYLVDRSVSSRPKAVRYVVEIPLEIKAGQRSAKVEIPCSLTATNFSITFPQGLTYVYGDAHNEGKTEGAKAHPDPSVQVSLPDIADIDLKIPISLGFASNPLSFPPRALGWAMLSCLALLFAWAGYLSGLTAWSLLPWAIAGGGTLSLFVDMRTYQRLRVVLSKYPTSLIKNTR